MVRPEDYGIELCGGGSSARASILPEGITDNFGLGAQGDIALTDRVSCWWMANAEPI